jgi:hypothetical protein
VLSDTVTAARNRCVIAVANTVGFSLPIRAIGRLEAPEHSAPEGDLEWASPSSPG